MAYRCISVLESASRSLPPPPLHILPPLRSHFFHLLFPITSYFGSRPSLRVRAESTTSPFQTLDDLSEALRVAPAVDHKNIGIEVGAVYTALQSTNTLKKWGRAAAEGVARRNVFPNELTRAGLINADKLAVPSVRNDAAFLFTVVAASSVGAVAASFLPGDWGFFSSYLIGGISLGVLAIGSINPALLQVFIDRFSRVFPDYRERITRHEAAHFLVAYLLGVPVGYYSLDLGREQTMLMEAKLQARLFEKNLEDGDIDLLAVVAAAGIAAEGTKYEEVIGQTADLMLLQRILTRSTKKLNDQQQQSVTRWAVWRAANLLKENQKEYEALMAAMDRGATVSECVQAIEQA